MQAIISRWNQNGAIADFERFAQEYKPLWEEQEHLHRQHIERGDGEDNNREEVRFEEKADGAAKYILFINVDAEQKRLDEDVNKR